MSTMSEQTKISAADKSEEPLQAEGGYREPLSIYITDDWDTQMDEFFEDYDGMLDVDFPPSLDEF